jgi:sugar lactone lactonase YvrE
MIAQYMVQVLRKRSLIPVWLCAAAFILLLSTGCVISPRRTFGQVGATPTPTPTPTPGVTPTPTPTPVPALGKLYVSNSNANSILRFDGALTATGNVSPAATITGAATALNTPAFITLDVANDRLYVADNGSFSILIFDNISTKTGNVAPERIITGGNTNLVLPVDVAIDTSKDLLYVADDIDVLVFASASTANGNVSSLHDLIVNFTASAIFIDAANDTLYVADSANNAIHVYNSASTLDGPVTATRTILGAATHLANPGGVQLDGSGRLVVSNNSASGPSITVYSNASTANGNVAPSGEIKGSLTGFILPDQIAVDKTGTGTVYNADSGAGRVAAYANLSTATGNISPTRTLTGTNTTLSVAGRPEGVAIDPTR